MRGLNLTKTTRMRSNGYFSMIGDDLIVPSSMANLQETYFNNRVQDYKTKPELKARVKELLKDTGSGIYFNPKFNNTLSLDEISAIILKIADNKVGTGLAWDNLANAKRFRSDAISNMKGNWALIPRNTLESQVNDSIKNATFPKKNDYTFKGTTRDNINSAIDSIYLWVIYQTAGEAYNNELNRREQLKSVVDTAIAKGDLTELKRLSSLVKFKDLKTNIDDTIKAIEEAKKAAEEKQKAIDEANRKLSGATTPEEKKAAQAELDALLRAGSDGAGAIARGTGLPKGAIYIGIGLVVAIGAYFMFRKKA